MECPDCGAYYTEKDEFCGECGRRLSPEGSTDAQQPEAWSAGPDNLEALAGDLFEPPKPEPKAPKAQPKKSNLRPIALVAGLAVLMLCLCVSGVVVWIIMSENSTDLPPTNILSEDSTAVLPTSTMAELGALLYEEDFDDPASGSWSTFLGEETAVDYEDGGYRMTVDRAQYIVWGNPEPELDLADMVIEVDVRQVEGPLDNNFGVFLRYQEGDDQHSYYWFQISADGFYSVDLKLKGEWISLEGWVESDAIETGLGVTNHMRIDCSGGQFSFYNNNVHLVDVFDETLDRGSIGLAAGTFEEPGIVVQFDDVRVYEPGE